MKTEGPLLSVIMPVRNGGRWLAEAVDSILAQDCQDLELLVIDDHSDDGAVHAMHGRDRRLRVLSSPGNGIVAALNHGFAQARGEFLARMDADDVAHPQRLSRQLLHLRRHPEVDICAAQVRIDGPAASGGARRYEAWLNALTEPKAIANELFVESPLPHPTILLHRSIWQQLGRYQIFDGPEDYGLWLHAASLGLRFGKPQGVLLHWRDHHDRLTRTDARYADTRFLQLKVRHLLSWRFPDRPFWIWGAGPSGAVLFDALTVAGATVQAFVDLHPRRIGGRKRGRPVLPLQAVTDRPSGAVVLVAVGSAGAREEIRSWCETHDMAEGIDYLFTA